MFDNFNQNKTAFIAGSAVGGFLVGGPQIAIAGAVVGWLFTESPAWAPTEAKVADLASKVTAKLQTPTAKVTV